MKSEVENDPLIEEKISDSGLNNLFSTIFKIKTGYIQIGEDNYYIISHLFLKQHLKVLLSLLSFDLKQHLNKHYNYDIIGFMAISIVMILLLCVTEFLYIFAVTFKSPFVFTVF